jgi:DNA-binding NtrC family response regulator
LLTDVFLRRFEKEFAKRPHRVSPEVLDLFLRYRWEGNVRELENVVECAVAISEGQQIGLNDIPMPLRGLAVSGETLPPLGVKPFSVAKGEFEKEYLTTLLQKVNGNISQAARLASLPRSYLYEKLKKAGVCREWSRASAAVAAIPDTVQVS